MDDSESDAFAHPHAYARVWRTIAAHHRIRRLKRHCEQGASARRAARHSTGTGQHHDMGSGHEPSAIGTGKNCEKLLSFLEPSCHFRGVDIRDPYIHRTVIVEVSEVPS